MSDIWTLVHDLLGTLPIEMHWLYGACTFVLFLAIVCIIASPFLFAYCLTKR